MSQYDDLFEMDDKPKRKRKNDETSTSQIIKFLQIMLYILGFLAVGYIFLLMLFIIGLPLTVAIFLIFSSIAIHRTIKSKPIRKRGDYHESI